MSLSIIIQDKYLFTHIYEYLSIESQIRLGLVNKLAYKYHKKYIPRIKQLLDGAILSEYYMLTRDKINEIRIYNEYNVQYTYVLKNYKNYYNNDYTTYVNLLIYRYYRNWNGIRKSVDIEYPYHCYFGNDVFITDLDYVHMLTNDEIFDYYLALLRMIDDCYYDDINIHGILLSLDDQIIKTLGIETRNNILMKDFAIIEFFLERFNCHTKNKLCEWLCKSLEALITDYSEKKNTKKMIIYWNGKTIHMNYSADIHNINQYMKDRGIITKLNNHQKYNENHANEKIKLINWRISKNNIKPIV